MANGENNDHDDDKYYQEVGVILKLCDTREEKQ